MATGHLIDSGLVSRYLRVVVENGGSYDLHRFEIGRTVQDFSTVELTVRAPDAARFDRIVDNLIDLGCHPKDSADSLLKPSGKDGTVPDDFYSTTNYRTVVRVGGREIDVDGQRMDACIVVTKLSDRGSAQTIGVITDVGLFLRLLADELSAG